MTAFPGTVDIGEVLLHCFELEWQAAGSCWLLGRG
jgi:hypothetical protein